MIKEIKMKRSIYIADTEKDEFLIKTKDKQGIRELERMRNQANPCVSYVRTQGNYRIYSAPRDFLFQCFPNIYMELYEDCILNITTNLPLNDIKGISIFR